jgi:hypothetical protein
LFQVPNPLRKEAAIGLRIVSAKDGGAVLGGASTKSPKLGLTLKAAGTPIPVLHFQWNLPAWSLLPGEECRLLVPWLSQEVPPGAYRLEATIIPSTMIDIDSGAATVEVRIGR